jgi:uncharacterized membrane protein YcaP (DUF421 family)
VNASILKLRQGVDEMWSLAFPAWDIVLRTAVVYLVILVGLRLAGKREIGQMTVFDLVVLLLIANAVQNAMVGPDTSLGGGVLAVAVLLLLNTLVARLRLRWPGLRRAVEGSPTVLVLHGAKDWTRIRWKLPCANTVLPS